MYRVVKKTTQKSQYKCLNCKHCKKIDAKIETWGCYVECVAENRCFQSSFNARDFYCQEYKGFNDMSAYEQNELREKLAKDYSKKAFKEYANKYYSKKQAQQMIQARGK